MESKLISIIKPYTLLDEPRLDNLWKVSLYLNEKGIKGAFVECGVMNGGSAGLIASIGRDRQTWLFDSWNGLPEPTKYDVKFPLWNHPEGVKGKKGADKGSEEKVRELLFDKLGLEKYRVHLIKGWFEDTILGQDIGKIALLHLDCDWYESVKLCLETLYDQVVENGIIVVDDYTDWRGCKKAVDEFIKGKDVRLQRAGRVLDIQKRKE